MASDFFSNLIERIFPEKGNQGLKLPLHTEALERNTKYKFAYAEWCGSKRMAEMLRVLTQQLEQARVNGASNPALQVYESPQSNGFYFNKMTGFDRNEFHFVLDHFCEITLQLGYRLQIAERRYSERPNGVHCLERYYLKPDVLKEFNPPLDQRYGNIHLELVLMNEEPSFLKVMAHVYHDRNYKQPLGFDALTTHLFQSTPLS